MCYKVECPKCHKATWKGCGFHINTALNGVPMYDRCPGWPTGKCTADSKPIEKESEKGEAFSKTEPVGNCIVT